MRLLLDSNVLLWSIADRRRLAPRVLGLLGDDDNDLFVSRASIWEISIKVAKGKLNLPGSSVRLLLVEIEKAGIALLPIEDAHILKTESLPHPHRDPFDRILGAQAMVEELTILTADAEIVLYEAAVIW